MSRSQPRKVNALASLGNRQQLPANASWIALSGTFEVLVSLGTLVRDCVSRHVSHPFNVERHPQSLSALVQYGDPTLPKLLSPSCIFHTASAEKPIDS
jgi:hypothetical protein